MSADRYRQLYESGRLHDAARRARTVPDMAAALGMGTRTLAEWAHDCPDLPSPGQILRSVVENRPRDTRIDFPIPRESTTRNVGGITKDSGSPHQDQSALDTWDVEPTNPGYAPPHYAVEDIEPVEEHRLKRRVRELEAENARLMDEVLNTRDMLGVAREAAQHRVAPLEMRERTSGRREACSLVVISDNHIEESTSLEKTNGLNEHNPEIARARMARIFEGARWLTQHARQSHTVRDVILAFLGDGITGEIHEDLAETNALSTPEAIALLIQIYGDGIRHFLADPEIESIRCVCQGGNHGRLTKRIRVHRRTDTNLETLVFLALAREFANESRVHFDLPQGAFTYIDVYGRTIRAMHGDSFNYAGGIGGIYVPINRGIARLDRSRAADLSIFGHFHQYVDAGHWICNGSSIGWGEFAQWIHAPYERPQQAWALLDSKRWRSLSAPIWCDENERQAA